MPAKASLQTVARRVAWVVGLVVHTVRALAIAALVGALALGGALVRSGDGTAEVAVLAAAVTAVALVVPLVLGRFARDLAPARALPDVRPEDLRRAAVTLGGSLRSGQQAFVAASGLRRVRTLGRALWDLRADVATLDDAGLAPASALAATMVPTRLWRVGIAALVAPAQLAVGLLALLVALVTS